eukprot:gene6472-13070_t
MSKNDYVNIASLAEKHRQSFTRSLPRYTETHACEQERRQVVLKETPIRISVHVAREDFPTVSAQITFSYLQSASQGAWKSFLNEVHSKLNLEFIDSIYDKYDKSPVHRILRLKNGGSYFVRQREESAVLEVLNTGQTPVQISWPITRVINVSKDLLTIRDNAMGPLNEKVHRLVHQPIARAQERESSKAILSASSPSDILGILDKVMTSEAAPPETEEEREQRVFEETKRMRAMQLLSKDVVVSSDSPGTQAQTLDSDPSMCRRTHDKEVDVVSLHRLSLEAMQRLLAKRKSPSKPLPMNNDDDDDYDEEYMQLVEFLQRVVPKYMQEIDIVVMALNLIQTLTPLLTRHKKKLLHLILSVLQAYAPPAPPNRLRNPRRLLLSQEEEEAVRAEQDALRLAEMMVREENEVLKLRQKESVYIMDKVRETEQAIEGDAMAAIKRGSSSSSSDDDVDRSRGGGRKLRSDQLKFPEGEHLLPDISLGSRQSQSQSQGMGEEAVTSSLDTNASGLHTRQRKWTGSAAAT